MYEEVDSNSLKVLSSNDTIEEIKNKIGIDINFSTNEFALGKKLDIIIKNEKQEEKVVSIDNPYYLVGVIPENGYHFLRFCHKDKMPIHEYRIEENDLVYHYVYNYFAVGAFYDYGISPNEWGYNPGTGTWLGTEYTFNFTVESVTKLDEKYIPEIISREGHTHSFNDLEDKPFERFSFDELDCLYQPNSPNNVVNANGEKILYLGKSTFGHENFRYITDSNGRIYKVPFNKVNDSLYLHKATFNLTGGNEITIYNVSLASGGTIDGITFPSEGTYATLSDDGTFITKIEYAYYDTIDEKFIPDSIARTVEVDEKLNNYYLKTEADNLHTEIEEYVDTLKTYIDNTIAQKSQVQIITWEADD